MTATLIAPLLPPTTRTATRPVLVHDVRRVADDVLAVALVAEESETLPPWEPGSHIDVHLPSGTVRQYSLCSDPADLSRYRIAILREPFGRGGSEEMHQSVSHGARLRISAPRNTFPLVDAPDYRLIAGGIGITPLLAMARALDARARPARLLYIGASRSRMALADELRDLTSVAVSVVAADEIGRPDIARFAAGAGPAAVYACGPDRLLDAVTEACRQAPPGGGLHLERFTAAPPAVDDSGEGFAVELARQHRTIQVNPGTTILEALRGSGVGVLSSCEQGICGTCETAVLAGDVDHRDDILTDEEKRDGRTMMVCVSRCAGRRLVLDI
jgi:ferredoxin-NADP reductase